MKYLITSKKNMELLISENYEKCFGFIVKNNDAKIRVIDYRAKPRILNRRIFLKNYLENTDDLNKFFALAEIMIAGRTNLVDFFSEMGKSHQWNAYKLHNQKIL